MFQCHSTKCAISKEEKNVIMHANVCDARTFNYKLKYKAEGLTHHQLYSLEALICQSQFCINLKWFLVARPKSFWMSFYRYVMVRKQTKFERNTEKIRKDIIYLQQQCCKLFQATNLLTNIP